MSNTTNVVEQWDVISPDGFSIHREDTYPSREAGLAAFEKWKTNYERQGYYSSPRYGRIPLDELHEYCELVKLDNDEY